ncbi:hypothetical protein HI914_00943 [Erysiphe necator]|nr:hypothetical protein HI914_00943 [Erysiphe necator]
MIEATPSLSENFWLLVKVAFQEPSTLTKCNDCRKDKDIGEHIRDTIEHYSSITDRRNVKRVIDMDANDVVVNSENKCIDQVDRRANACIKLSSLESKIETELKMVDLQVNGKAFEEALVNIGNTCYITISKETVRKLYCLPRSYLGHITSKESVKILAK